MGTLIAWRYPTNIALRLADHTYVTCDNGAVRWGCWGGSQGGTALRQGPGSTNRANAIAEPDEKANIRCYLINGVCHQAANRILYPAGILITGARGYGVSQALFGPYGRPHAILGFCHSPFHQHANVQGDIKQCTEDLTFFSENESASLKQLQDKSGSDANYIKIISKEYEKTTSLNERSKDYQEQLDLFMVSLFIHMTESRLGAAFLETSPGKQVVSIRKDTEASRKRIEDAYARKELTLVQFADSFNRETIAFQEKTANVLNKEQYKKLFDLEHGDTIILADPDIIKEAPSKLG